MNKEEKNIFRRMVVLLWMCILLTMAQGGHAEAATTCKSAISYPAKTNSAVNLRKKAGTNYKSYGTLKKNQSVTILGYVSNKGTKWYKCKAKVNGKSKTGYINSAYVVKVSKPNGVVNKKVSTYLNVRKSAKSSAKSLLKLPKNTQVKVLGIKKVSGKYWYKIKATYNNKTKTGYVLGSYITVDSTGTAEEPRAAYVNEKVDTYLNVRESADSNGNVLVRLPKHTPVTVLGTSGSWYRMTVTYNDKTVTGYAVKEYITIGTLQSDPAVESNLDFDVLLANFPESYQTELLKLHAQYPNWRFVAVNTNLDWATVISNESVVGRNVIQSNYPKGTNSLAPLSYLSTDAGAYNWETDQYTVKDGTNWYAVNSEVVSYYMDPRNFLNANDIFQFEALAYDASQSDKVVQSILSNTFMKGNYSVVDSATKKKASGSYKQAFMDAGQQAKANPYFLASRSKQEVGVNGSSSTSGTYKGYEGLYNFYNIGASDGGDAAAKGLVWAGGGTSKSTTYGRPWTTPYKSIVGGAQYIAKNYINVGQNTLYFQKFNVVPTNETYRYQHQYMTNVTAPYQEGRTTRNAYEAIGVLSDTMIFYIPVYQNMPGTACSLPPVAGNPNPYLSSIKVTSGSSVLTLTPTFKYNKYTYSIAVAKSVSQVTVNASTISKKASVSGTGTINLSDPGQTTTVILVGKAESGATQTYTIHITRNTQ